jgi:tetratricopeptide (TPR) repeat protein
MVWVALGAAVMLGGCSGTHQSKGPAAQSPEEKFVRARELNQEALAAQKNGKSDKAIGLYREVVQLAPKMFQAWNNLGVLYMEQQNYVEAALALKSAADIAPGDPVPLENLGLAYYRAGYADRSLTYYVQAIERAPTRPEGYRGAYRASEQLGLKDPAALDRVQKALLVETDPTWRDLYVRKRIWLSNEPGNQSAAR